MADSALEWGSFLPALTACVAVTKGPVLEFGVGHYSSPVLHAMVLACGRKLVSVESDPVWYELISKRFLLRDVHVFDRCEYSEAVSKYLVPWGVVFIDSSPGGQARADLFKAFISLSQFVVVHDYHSETVAAIAPLLGGLKVHICNMYPPPTLVASKECDIPNGVLGL